MALSHSNQVSKSRTYWPPHYSLHDAWKGWWSFVARTFTNTLGYRQRCLLEEYGPALCDIFLSTPVVRLLRFWTRKIWTEDRDVSAEAPLLQLPDELLLLILDYLGPLCQHSHCKSTSRQWRRDVASVSGSCRRLHSLAGPLLYRKIALVYGWSRTRRALQNISNTSEIRQAARSLRIAPCPMYGIEWMPTAPFALPLTLAVKSCALNTLHLIIPQPQVQAVKRCFEEKVLNLPSIKVLVLAPGLEFVVNHCPNVISVASGRMGHGADTPHHVPDLVHAAGMAKSLQHLELLDDWHFRSFDYPAHAIDSLHAAVPDLEGLAISGPFHTRGPDRLIRLFRRLEKLKCLALPSLEDLNVGDRQFRGICGNPYLGPGGRERHERDRQRWRRQDEKDAQDIAEAAFACLVGLEKLWIGQNMLFTPISSPRGSGRSIALKYQRRQLPGSIE